MPDGFMPILTGGMKRLRDLYDGCLTEQWVPPESHHDLSGRLKVSQHQNIYEADFEYGLQPLRWEAFTAGAGSITALPGLGGVRMRLTTAAGDVTIRQSRAYHRYQAGKTMAMASAVMFGTALAGQRQRVGFFDNANGVFFEQADPVAGTNPFGMHAVIRSDVNGVPVDTRIPLNNWRNAAVAATILWDRIQMIFIEYAWYGAGTLRWGVVINGEPIILHYVGHGNSGATLPWARTGNLPVRYEQRNITGQAAVNDMIHWGVSVLVDGQANSQRGFTYGYGMANGTPRRLVAANSTRFPLLSFRYRVMGAIEFTQGTAAATAGTTTTLTVTGTPWTVNQWAGRYVFFPGLGGVGQGIVARITSNTNNTLTFQNNIIGGPIAAAPGAGANYQIGMLNRGQILPKSLKLSSDQPVTVELITSTPTNPIVLTGANFASLVSLGSANSFAERDVSATALAGGEVVYNTPSPSGGLNDFDLSDFFPLYTNIAGNAPDILTVAISTTAATAANVGCSIVAQEAMS